MSDFVARSPLGLSDEAPRARARDRKRGPRGPRDSRGGEPRGDRTLAFTVAAAIVLSLSAATAVLLPPLLLVRRYEISGLENMTREDVLSAGLIHDKEYFFSLDSSRVESALAADPRVASVEVSKLFPDGLRIAVKERKAVAIAEAELGDRTTAVCIDSDGVAFAEASAKEAAAAPAISGIRFEGFRLGTRLPASLAPIFSSLAAVEGAEPGLLSAFSEIRVVAPAAGGAPGDEAVQAAPTELLLYPLNQRIPVRVAASLDVPTLRSIILVLDVLGTKGLAATVQEIDFRTGTVVYRSKEGQSG
jgi:cell division protein FtsQ